MRYCKNRSARYFVSTNSYYTFSTCPTGTTAVELPRTLTFEIRFPFFVKADANHHMQNHQTKILDVMPIKSMIGIALFLVDLPLFKNLIA